MRLLRNLPAMIDQMPPWAQILVGVLLVAFALSSIYGRMNPKFGTKIFSRIAEEDIRQNLGHIVRYTVMPCLVAAVYFWAWLG